MAAIYDPETGTAISEGLQGSDVCDAAWQAAVAIAAERGAAVELVDDDGLWLVRPDGTRSEIEREDSDEDD